MDQNSDKNNSPHSKDQPDVFCNSMDLDTPCMIIGMYWKNVYLHIQIRNFEDKRFFLKSPKGKIVSLPLKQTLLENACRSKDEVQAEIVLNVTTVKDRTFLENERYRLIYFERGTSGFDIDEMCTLDEQQMLEYKNCILNEEVAYKLDDLSRVFRYLGLSYAYTIDFNPYTHNNRDMHLQLNSAFMMLNSRYMKLQNPRISFSLVGFLKRILLRFKWQIIRVVYRALCLAYKLLPKKKTRILLLTEVKDKIDGNLLALFEKLHEMGLKNSFDVDVSARVMIGRENSYASWFRTLRKIAKSDYIFVDNFAPILAEINLDSRVRLIQLWHAGVGFKAVGYSRFGKSGSPHPTRSIHRRYSQVLSPSESLIHVYAEVFGVEEEAFIPVGLPRFDNFFDTQRQKTFRDNFYAKNPELVGKKLILFAPTFRGKGQADAYYDYAKIDFEKLAQFCGEEYVVALKMHPFITRDTIEEFEAFCTKNPEASAEEIKERRGRIKPDISIYGGRIVDLSKGYDINELFHLSDILITDYSSAYYEFSSLRRPILFFTYDRALYENVRGVHQGVKESAPGKVCDSFDELLNALQIEDFDIEKTEQFADTQFYGEQATAGGATERLIREVLL